MTLVTFISCLFLFEYIALADIPNISVTRLAGKDRYGTCGTICEYGWKSGSKFAVVATGEDFPDALSAAPLAKKYNAPIIITHGKSLDDNAASELKRLNVNNVFIMGGIGAVSQDVENQIKAMKINTTRISGSDRYETTVNIAGALDPSNGVVLVSGDDYPGALFMAPIAAKKGIPILLIKRDSIPDSVKNYLKNKNVAKYYVIGGEDVISNTAISGLNPIIRINGADKYERNLNAINAFSSDLDFSKVYIATGENFPDALSGAAMASMTDSPIILMVNKTLSDNARNLINSNISKVKEIYLLGGQSVVDNITIGSSGILPQNIPSQDNQSSDNTSNISFNGNISNDGYAATDGNYIYYSPSNSIGLWRMNMDGSGNTMLTYDTPRYINVYNGYVYYCCLNDNNYIYRICADGTGRSMIVNNAASYLNVKNGFIYFSNDSYGGTLYKINIDGSGKLKINDDKSKFINVVDNNIYYSNISDGGHIYSMRTDGTTRKKLNNDYSTYLIVYNGYIYYINQYGDNDIYKLKLDMTNKLKLNVINSDESSITSMNYNGTTMYFKVKDSRGYTYFYSTGLDGTRKSLSSNYTSNITLISGNVFYE